LNRRRSRPSSRNVGCLTVSVIAVVALAYSCIAASGGNLTASPSPRLADTSPTPAPQECAAPGLAEFLRGVDEAADRGAVTPQKPVARAWIKALKTIRAEDDEVAVRVKEGVDAVEHYLKAVRGSEEAWGRGRTIAYAAVELAEHCGLKQFVIPVPPQKKPEPTETSRPPAPEVGTDPRFGSCAAANRAGYGPYRRGDAEYRWYEDRDGDGVVCER
jgi:Excalibur calcium-binding domain